MNLIYQVLHLLVSRTNVLKVFSSVCHHNTVLQVYKVYFYKVIYVSHRNWTTSSEVLECKYILVYRYFSQTDFPRIHFSYCALCQMISDYDFIQLLLHGCNKTTSTCCCHIYCTSSDILIKEWVQYLCIWEIIFRWNTSWKQIK